MSTKLLAGVAVAALFGFAAPALAQSASAEGTGSIIIVRPLTITKNADLHFGAVARPASGNGEVIMSPEGARSVTGGLITLNVGPTPSAARFTVTGEGGQTVSITVPQNFQIQNGQSQQLQVQTSTDVSGSRTLSNSSGSSGTTEFRVGGRVMVSNGTEPGTYTGTFTVTANYN